MKKNINLIPNNLTLIPEDDLEINPYAYTGVNLAEIRDWSPELPFINLFKTARTWITQNKTIWDTKETSRLNLDENGYLKTLTPIDGGTTNYSYVGTVINNNVGSYLGGKYVVLYDGEGTLEYLKDAKKDFTASTPGRDVLDIKPTNSGIYVKLTSTDPKKTGNYLRNIRMVPLAAEKTFERDIFNPTFIEKFKDFKSLRLTHWMDVNNSAQANWSDRPKPNFYTYTNLKGVPVEVMVALANKSTTDPWFSMPHLATDDYVRNFATYVKNNLNPNLKVYVEYTNESWNYTFNQIKYIQEQGKKEFPSLDPVTAGWDWFSKRTTQITKIWDQVFGSDKDRVIGVMAAQSANVYSSQRLVSYAWAGANKPTHQATGIDAIAIAPYFGYYLGSSKFAPQVEAWTQDADGGLKKLFDEVTKGGVITGGPVGGALQESYTRIQTYMNLADQQGLDLLGYEGGQHLAVVPGTYGNQKLINLFIAANRDPRMGEVYKQYLSKWYEIGGEMMAPFSSVAPFTQWGSWGLLERLDQTNSAKYNALIDLIRGNFN